MMRPLRLEWRLSSPVAGMALPLHLDALVAYAVTQEAIANGATGPIGSLADNLPLEKEVRGDLWCWKASALMAPASHGHAMRLWTRRTDEYDYAERYGAGQFAGTKTKHIEKPYGGIIDTARGEMKNHFQFMPVRSLPHFVAYCIGDEDRLLELLHPDAGHILTLGKRGAMGLGKIMDNGFVIEPDDCATERWSKRVLPWPQDNAMPIQAAHRPPYWAIENRTTSYLDGSLLV